MGTLIDKVRIMITLLLLSAIKIFLIAEVTSGFWTLAQPTSDERNNQIDFSELTPFCGTYGLANECNLSAADCDFKLGSVVSLGGGIQRDTSLEEYFKTQLTRSVSNPDRHTLFFMDSLMKKEKITAPAAGYTDSVEAGGSVFFLKTVEDHYAILIKVGEYIGGINRITYYWVYQSGGEKRLHKDGLIDLPPRLTIGLSVFSGRHNPVFTLTDPDAIARIVHGIYTSVNIYLDSTVQSDDTSSCPAHLGYRLLSVTDMFVPYEPQGNFLYTLDICNGRIILTTDMMTSMMPPRQFFHDPDLRLEKLIISICCSLNLQTSTETGPVDFCGVVPDSLKSEIGNEPSPGGRQQANGFNCICNGKTLQVTMSKASILCVDVFDLNGRCLNSSNDYRLERGLNTRDVQHLFSHSGMYIIRVRSDKIVKVFSLVIQ